MGVKGKGRDRYMKGTLVSSQRGKREEGEARQAVAEERWGLEPELEGQYKAGQGSGR